MPRDRHDLLLITNLFGMALELLPALGQLGDLGLINNFSGISLGSCRRRTWSPFYCEIRINDLAITFLLIRKVIDKSGTGQAAATGLINNLPPIAFRV